MTVRAATLSNASFLGRRHGNPVWDGVLRGSGLVALLAIAAIHLWPEVGPLAGFVAVTVWVNGPLAFFFPATYEPILMLFGRLYPPLVIAVLGTAGTIYVEYLNYRLYQKAIGSNVLSGFRENNATRKVAALFTKAPFFTVWLCSWSILPYWSVRVLSPLAGFPVSKHLWATLLGRFPRLWFFAAIGELWDVDVGLLLLLSSIAVLITLASTLLRLLQRKGRARTVPRSPEISACVITPDTDPVPGSSSASAITAGS